MRSACSLRGFGSTSLRHYDNTLAPTPIRDYAPSLRSPWRAAVAPLPAAGRRTSPTFAEKGSARLPSRPRNDSGIDRKADGRSKQTAPASTRLWRAPAQATGAETPSHLPLPPLLGDAACGPFGPVLPGPPNGTCKGTRCGETNNTRPYATAASSPNRNARKASAVAARRYTSPARGQMLTRILAASRDLALIAGLGLPQACRLADSAVTGPYPCGRAGGAMDPRRQGGNGRPGSPSIPHGAKP